MESKARKKRSSDTSQRKERRDSVKSGTRTRSANSMVTKSSDTKSSHAAKTHSVLGIPINSGTAKQAIILSEIIGKPVSKRGKRW